MIDTKECAAKLGVNMKRVAVLASTGRIKGAKKLGGRWAFPDKPVVTPGTRMRPGKYMNQKKDA